jgi:hypothetical protein
MVNAIRNLKNLPRWLVGAVGIVLLGVGALQARRAAGEAGTVALVVAGAVLLISPFIIDRLEQLSVSGSGLELRLSRAIVELGAPDTARILETTGLAGFAESYALIHEELRDPKYREARVYLQDLLVERAAAIARRQKFKPSEVRALFRDGSPLMRVLILGLMEGDPSLADAATIASAISDSRSGNEQYHGLNLALLCWRQLSKSERNAVRGGVAESPYIRDDSDRQKLADELLSLPVS